MFNDTRINLELNLVVDNHVYSDFINNRWNGRKTSDGDNDELASNHYGYNVKDFLENYVDYLETYPKIWGRLGRASGETFLETKPKNAMR